MPDSVLTPAPVRTAILFDALTHPATRSPSRSERSVTRSLPSALMVPTVRYAARSGFFQLVAESSAWKDILLASIYPLQGPRILDLAHADRRLP